MALPLAYNFRNLTVRRTTTVMTALGIALTVAVLVAILAVVQGLYTAFQASGDPLNILVLRKGSQTELVSNFTRTAYQDLKVLPGIARDAKGEPLASLEMVTVLDLKRPGESEGANVTLRGLPLVGIGLRDNIRVIQGRWFETGKREVVVGKSTADRFQAGIGRSLTFGRGSWEVVGVFDAGQSSANSEIWGDLNQISSDFSRPEVLSSALVRATDALSAEALIRSINDDRSLNATAMSEITYYEDQMVSGAPVKYIGLFVAITMAIGSSFATMNTMYAAVARRGREIGTLRVLGFTRGSILLSFFLESVLLSLLGGALGCLLVLPMNGMSAGIGNFITFSEIAFHIQVSPRIMAIGVSFALIMGALGGLFPGRLAAKKEILTALREG